MNSYKTYKKLVVLTSRFPFPLEKGDKLRAYYQIKELAKSFEVHLISLSEKDIKPEFIHELEKYCASITIHPIHPLLKWFFAGIQLLGNKPYQIGYFYHPRIAQKINKQLHQLQPDHIYCQLIRASEYVKNYHECPKTLDYMDALSKGIERRIHAQPFWKRWLFTQEFKRLRKYENIIFEYFEHHTIISKQDQQFIFHHKRNKISIIPNGVDSSFLEKIPRSKTHDLVFIGNMSYAPNIDAAKFLVHEVLPLLPVGTQLLLAGADPSQEITAFASDRITISGWVEDIREAYLQGKVFVAPMFIGTGLQNKLLEAMALGVPCVTTSMANNALGAKPEKDILIAETAYEFSKKIQLLLSDETAYHAIQSAGKNYIEQHFNWINTTQTLIDLINHGKTIE